MFALLSSVVLSLYNVSVKIIYITKPNLIFGIWNWEGIIHPGVGNSMFILFIRMVVVVLLMPAPIFIFYPSIWQHVQRLWQNRTPRFYFQMAGCGLSMFVSQVLIYVALGEMPAGIAIAIFFIYPVVTVLISWVLFGNRPSFMHTGSLAVIIIGILLALPSTSGAAQGHLKTGIATAMGSGISFAISILLTQICVKTCPPLLFNLINFFIVFILSALSIFTAWIFNLWEIPLDAMGPDLILAGGWLGVLTLISYLLNTIAISLTGAMFVSIVSAIGPALTALFAFLIISEFITLAQWGGILLVTLSVLALGIEGILRAKHKDHSS